MLQTLCIQCTYNYEGRKHKVCVWADRGPGQQSVSPHDDVEEAPLDHLLPDFPPTSSVSPPSSSPPDSSPQTPSPSDNTALGVVGMLRRLRLWTEEDARNGTLTILPKSIGDWLRSTNRYAPSLAHFPVCLLTGKLASCHRW